MKTQTVGAYLVGLALLAAGGGCQHAKGEVKASLQLHSSAFDDGATIPREYTCDGKNVSPPLAWRGAPEGTQAFALIVDDPDAPSGTFVHWVAFDLPASTHGLRRAASTLDMPHGAKQGRNGFGKVGYGGMCPPPGDDAHRYFFRLYALDAPLGLAAGASRAAVDSAMEGHIRASGQLVGRYRRASHR